MSEKTDIVALLRDELANERYVSSALVERAADEIEQLRLERDAANDRVNALLNEVCW
jgi:hypothetical protein